MLETVRRRLRALIKLIPKGQKKVVYTDFQDELGETSVIDLPHVTAGLNMNKFKEKARDPGEMQRGAEVVERIPQGARIRIARQTADHARRFMNVTTAMLTKSNFSAAG